VGEGGGEEKIRLIGRKDFLFFFDPALAAETAADAEAFN
jgi:hypothetical protein